jgi:hypothetical protein
VLSLSLPERIAAAAPRRFPLPECDPSPTSPNPGLIRPIPATSPCHGRCRPEGAGPGNGGQPGCRLCDGLTFCGAAAAAAGRLLLPRCSLPFGLGSLDVCVWLDHWPVLV